MRRIPAFILLSAFLSVPLWSHKGKTHALSSAKNPEANLKKINAAYIQDVRPIFKKKCFDCHSTVERLPWYYKLPLARQLMDYDMREAKEHLDMRQDFPFAGHGIPLADLGEIEEVVEEGSMPPWYYRLVRRGSALSLEEIEKIKKWTQESKELLR